MGFHVIHASGYYGWRFNREPNRFRLIVHGQHADEIVQDGNHPSRIDGPMSVYADGFESYYLTRFDRICIDADGTLKKIDERSPSNSSWVTTFGD